MPFERRALGGATVAAPDLVAKLRQAEHGGVQRGQHLVRSLAAFGAVRDGLLGQAELDGDLLVQVAEVVTVVVVDTALVEDELEGGLQQLLRAGDGGGRVGADGAVDGYRGGPGARCGRPAGWRWAELSAVAGVWLGADAGAGVDRAAADGGRSG